MQKSIRQSNTSTMPSTKVGLVAGILILLIELYRYSLSPIFGNGCRFDPSCSHYAQDALRKYGAWRGSIMSIKRVLRCHPWHEPGYDPVE